MAIEYRFSRIAAALRPSPIRELFKLIQRPGMISFAGGLPDPKIFPVEEFAACADALSSKGTTALQYGATEGYAPLIDEVRRRMQKHLGRAIAYEEVLIGSGSQQAMDLLGRALLDPGDVVVMEAPTYPGAVHTLRNVGAKFALVASDDHGMVVDALAETIDRCRAQTGRLPKLIYTVINYSNPAGVSLSLARRKQLVEVSRRYGIPVLEDDPYGELRYDNEQIASLFSMAEEGVIYASSFSKILAPGTRVAWTIGDPELIRKMIMVKQGSDLCTSMVSQVLVAEYCARGYLDTHLTKIRSHYARKANAMNEALDRHLPQNTASFAKVRGGFFFWLKMAGRDTRQLFLKGIENGVAFVPGESFYPLAEDTIGALLDGTDCARLCFTFATEEEIEEGCRRLASCLA